MTTKASSQRPAQQPSGPERFGARFIAELCRLAEPERFVGKSRLKRIERLERDDLAAVLRRRFHWFGPEWLERIQKDTPEEFARAIVREWQIRGDESDSAADGTLAFLDLLVNFAMFS